MDGQDRKDGRDTLAEDALAYHRTGRPGKLEVVASKPMGTQRDLSLAYSPGVAAPVRAIAEDPDSSYDFTSRGNMVAVITNGTAILGLGNLGALASKPVMEGKAALFKRFADIDGVDLELDTEDSDEFINAVKLLGPSFGGINLEDIRAPECFVIEERLRELMDIPVFHDDQHGTAIICLAGLINALQLTGRRIEDVKIVLNGAGAAGIACIELAKALGAKSENCIVCDTRGVIYRGREAGMNQWKSAHAVETDLRTLEEAMVGADVFLGVSAKGALTPAMVESMAESPIIFAMANPDPEITPEEVAEVRDDAIMATGRSDYPNQVNNVLGFPYIFRGALDVRAKTINEQMKIAAAEALAELAREDVPEEVAAAYGTRLVYGPNYIIPAPFDPRLIHKIPPAVAKAAVESGVARRPIIDFGAYEQTLRQRLDPSASIFQALSERLRFEPRRIIFAHGKDERVQRAALAYVRAGFGTPILIGQKDLVRKGLETVGYAPGEDPEIEIIDPETEASRNVLAKSLYTRLQRRGYMPEDCDRMIRGNDVILGASLLTHGRGDGLVAGASRKSAIVLRDAQLVIDERAGESAVGVSALVAKGRTVLIADTLYHDDPTVEELADIAERAAAVARKFGLEPRVAMTAFSTFGFPATERSNRSREAVDVLRARGVDFEVDGEMAADVALDRAAMAQYPFCRLTGPANVLVTPARTSASLSTKLIKQLTGTMLIGPIVTGLEKPVQPYSMTAGVSEILQAAILAACRMG